MSIVVTTTKMIVEHLQSIIPDAYCRRSYSHVLDPAELEEIGKTALCVVPADRDAEHFTQGGMQKNLLIIDICINAKLKHSSDDKEEFLAEIDELIAFAEKIYSLFLKKSEKNIDGLKISFTQPEHALLCDYDMIHARSCFLSVVQVHAVVFAKPEV